MRNWPWAAPAKHSTRQIDRVLERIELLTSLKVDQHLAELPEAIVRRYARRLASRAPAVAARIAEPTGTIEVACFSRYGLTINTDHLLWMVRRRVADMRRKAAEEADAKRVNYERLYQQLLGELSALASDGTLSVAELQQKLNTLLVAPTLLNRGKGLDLFDESRPTALRIDALEAPHASTDISMSVVSTRMIRLLTAPNDSDRPGTAIMEPLWEKVERPVIMSEQPDRHTKRVSIALRHGNVNICFRSHLAPSDTGGQFFEANAFHAQILPHPIPSADASRRDHDVDAHRCRSGT